MPSNILLQTLRVLPSILLFFFLVHVSKAQDGDKINYFPKDISYDPNFPRPEWLLGYEVGEWHVSHDQLVYYMKEMARLSDRITIVETGRTYENRPLLLLTITSPENHAKIDRLKSEHVALSDPQASTSVDINNMPVVVWLGHSIHGNEPSGSNASLLTVYHWAAAQGDEIDEILKNTIILLDPSLNPDGLHRFSTWVNSNKGNNASANRYDREHNETWPGGRTNHYWFDLNRDWLPVQHPESKARIAKFHEWKPNILTDHHEMRSNRSFFFQPGIPSRNHPLIPKNTVALTSKIAAFHARELDKIGSLYFSQEGYDDFYFGKGSTYPDINGGIGILFEQASSRGFVQNTVNGKLRFPFTIKNQFTTAYSTVLAANSLRQELLEHQRSFYKNAQKAVQEDPVKGYVWSAGKDQSKARHFLDILLRHQLEVFRLGKNQRIGGKSFEKENSYLVKTNQTNYKVVKAIFEKRTNFQDSLFYDVSAWTFPLAMNLRWADLTAKSLSADLSGARIERLSDLQSSVENSNYAYALRWDDYYAPSVANKLLANGLILKVATEPFTFDSKQYDRGTVIIPVSIQDKSAEELYELIKKISEPVGISVEAITTGYTGGTNLGSDNFRSLKMPKVAILTDDVSPYEAGEVWHLLDYRMDMTVTLLPVDQMSKARLSDFNTIIMVGGSYSGLSGSKLKTWVQQGGLIVATGSAGKWLSNDKIISTKYKAPIKPDSLKKRAYADMSKFTGAQRIGGSIFNTIGDLTHPVLYGIEDENVPIFRRGTLMMKPLPGQYSNPLMYTEEPLLAGYISEENYEALKESAAITVSSYGAGRIVTFSDNPNLRAYWYGTNKLFLNAIFFGSIIESGATN
ncbi:MAG: zinc carboxypeptidase [Cyclobacteriaceae bacterium]